MRDLTASKAVQMKMGIAMAVVAHVLIDKAAFPYAGGEFFDLAPVAHCRKHTVDRAAPRGILGVRTLWMQFVYGNLVPQTPAAVFMSFPVSYIFTTACYCVCVLVILLRYRKGKYKAKV